MGIPSPTLPALFVDAPELPSADPDTLRFTVVGVPAPQGSKKAFFNKHLGRAMVVEDSAKTRPWRSAVSTAVAETFGDRPLIEGPVRVEITFKMPRPKGHFGARGLKDSAPQWPAKKPDIDKCARAILDSLTGIVWRDDSQVVDLRTVKVYALRTPGAVIEVTPLE